MSDHPANNNILLEDGPWKVVKSVEDKEYCEIWHHCADIRIEFTYVTMGEKKCFGCDAEVPERITTIATLYSKGVPSQSMNDIINRAMQRAFWKFKKDHLLNYGGVKDE